MRVFHRFAKRYARFKLQRTITTILAQERKQAETKLAQQWHWGDTGQRELAVVNVVQNWLLPLPTEIDALAFFNSIEQAFEKQLRNLRNSDPDGYAIGTNKTLAKVVLAAISHYGKIDANFTTGLGLQLLQTIICGDRPRISKLLEAGADTRVTDKFGRNALALALHCDELYAQEALLGPQALELASDSSWAVALRHGVYRFKQLPPQRVNEKLCDEALLGDRHNYYSLPPHYVALPNLAARCSARPMLIAQLPPEVAFAPAFYRNVRCDSPNRYWPVFGRNDAWLDYWLEQEVELYQSLSVAEKTESRSVRFVKRFGSHYGFSAVPADQLTDALFDAYLENEWELKHLPAEHLTETRILKARDNFLQSCKQRQSPGQLSEGSFSQFAAFGVSQELADCAALGNYQLLKLLDSSMITDTLLQQVLTQRTEWFGFELSFIASCVSEEQWLRVSAITPIMIHRQPGEFER